MSFLSLIGIEIIRLIDIITHIEYFTKNQIFLLNIIAYMAIGIPFIPLLLKTDRRGFIACFTLGVFGIGFLALDPDLFPILNSEFEPDASLILLFTFSPVLSALLGLFSYLGYKSLAIARQEKYEVMKRR